MPLTNAVRTCRSPLPLLLLSISFVLVVCVSFIPTIVVGQEATTTTPTSSGVVTYDRNSTFGWNGTCPITSQANTEATQIDQAQRGPRAVEFASCSRYLCRLFLPQPLLLLPRPPLLVVNPSRINSVMGSVHGLVSYSLRLHRHNVHSLSDTHNYHSSQDICSLEYLWDHRC